MEGAEARRKFDRSRLEMMRGYAEHDHCRRAFLLTYFGQPFEGAAAVAFLASDDATFVTGETLGVSGGLGMV